MNTAITRKPNIGSLKVPFHINRGIAFGIICIKPTLLCPSDEVTVNSPWLSCAITDNNNRWSEVSYYLERCWEVVS